MARLFERRHRGSDTQWFKRFSVRKTFPSVTMEGCEILLEDGEFFLLENGEPFFLEACAAVITDCVFLLEDGMDLLLEDGLTLDLQGC